MCVTNMVLRDHILGFENFSIFLRFIFRCVLRPEVRDGRERWIRAMGRDGRQ